DIALPIGISFFTFQKMSYLIDIYRGTAKQASSFFNYALYVALFPQLIAGPIIRYHDVANQIDNRTHTSQQFFYGIWRFCIGLGKKILIANTLGMVVDSVFSTPHIEITCILSWFAIIAYAFQIYFDFSGYSDMAIGLGRMMGFHFLENFNRPYRSLSITEFWRRWHISLSNWMKEYLYIPLGGNQVGKIRSYANLWIVFLISGLWHGASWNFVIWGGFHGFFLTVDKLFWLKKSKNITPVIKRSLTFIIVLFSWVLFRSETLSDSLLYLKRMFDFSSTLQFDIKGLYVFFSHRAFFVLFVATFLSFVPFMDIKNKVAKEVFSLECHPMKLIFHYACALTILLFSACSLASSGYNPFIYFRF
ncbi:hypothetical protein BVX93_02025, partial [bacterium B13(2017)]